MVDHDPVHESQFDYRDYNTKNLQQNLVKLKILLDENDQELERTKHTNRLVERSIVQILIIAVVITWLVYNH